MTRVRTGYCLQSNVERNIFSAQRLPMASTSGRGMDFRRIALRKCSRAATFFIRYEDLSEVGLRGSEGSVRAVVFYLLRGGIVSFSLSTPSNPLTNESAHCNWATEVLTHFWTATKSMDKSQALLVAADAISNTRRQVKRESKRNGWLIFALARKSRCLSPLF